MEKIIEQTLEIQYEYMVLCLLFLVFKTFTISFNFCYHYQMTFSVLEFSKIVCHNFPGDMG